MSITNSIVNYRRFLKRRNYSPHTVKNYLNTLKHFVVWVDIPIEGVTRKKVAAYVDHLLANGLAPKTINCHLVSIRSFYDYLTEQEDIDLTNPVRACTLLRLPRPLPRYVKDHEVTRLFAVMKQPRDRAMFSLMLRCGLRVEEVAHVSLADIDVRRARIVIHRGKRAKGRVVYVSRDAYRALVAYLKVRPPLRVKRVFVVEKGTYKGRPLSVRGIQKRMEYYARKAGLKVSCHQLRHTMATQLLNADAELVTIQDLLGHSLITTTQRYCRVSNRKVQRDYYKAMEVVMKRHTEQNGPLCSDGPSRGPFSHRDARKEA